MEKISIPKFTPQGGFTDEIKSVVHGYFENYGLSEKGDWRLFLKTFIILSLFFTCYCLLVFTNMAFWFKLPVVIFLGYYIIPGIGFCIMHDAIHGAYSKKKWVNYLAGLSLNFVGANNFLWKTKHNQIHHTHTNIDGFDEDIESGGVLRMHPEQEWKPWHKHQHKWWYWRGAYSLLYLQWIFWNDFKKYFKNRILYKSIQIPIKEHIVFWLSKIFYWIVFVVVPIFQIGFLWWLFGYITISLICSYRISLIFQLAHIVEGVEHHTKESMDKEEFFAHQIRTTADFDVNNRFVSWWVGGLNFQIEHHLFPKISHVHYPVIHRLIKPIIQKWGIEMVVNGTTNHAIKSHIRTLFKFGQKP